MTAAGLLHNMSVPPRSTIAVRRSRLPGRRFAVDLEIATSAVCALHEEGCAALPRLLTPARLDALVRRYDVPRPGDPHRLLDAWFVDALECAGVPDRIGVFVELDTDRDTCPRLPDEAALAVLARRSGPLYLPRRRFELSLIVPARLALVFPESLT